MLVGGSVTVMAGAGAWLCGEGAGGAFGDATLETLATLGTGAVWSEKWSRQG